MLLSMILEAATWKQCVTFDDNDNDRNSNGSHVRSRDMPICEKLIHFLYDNYPDAEQLMIV